MLKRFGDEDVQGTSGSPVQPIVSRAIEIARVGRCSNILQIRNQLAREGFSGGSAYLADRSLTDQLLMIMADSRRRKI